MDFLQIAEIKACPFCGADAEAKWVMDEKFGKSIRVSCSRDGECPSPSWTEACEDHGTDADCLVSVLQFWNTRAADWHSGEMNRLRVKLSETEQELRCVRAERDRAQKACEAIANNLMPDLDRI
jgi:hypothetical protein